MIFSSFEWRIFIITDCVDDATEKEISSLAEEESHSTITQFKELRRIFDSYAPFAFESVMGYSILGALGKEDPSFVKAVIAIVGLTHIDVNIQMNLGAVNSDIYFCEGNSRKYLAQEIQ